jgi:hypothetical protein
MNFLCKFLKILEKMVIAKYLRNGTLTQCTNYVVCSPSLSSLMEVKDIFNS